MKFLIDTNIFIPLEPIRRDDLLASSPAAAKLARLSAEGGHQLYVHPASRVDIGRDSDEDRRTIREAQISKYPMLPHPPQPSGELEARIGRARQGSNDWVDNQLLAALAADSIDCVITEDRGLHRKATAAALGGRVVGLDEGLAIVEAYSATPPPPPAVESVAAYALNADDPVFESLRDDYPGFDAWFGKCRRGHRQSWVIHGEDGRIAGLTIVKEETSLGLDIAGKVLKICSFKVSEQYNGYRYGELLLKTIFDYADARNFEWLYLTAFEKHTGLIRLLEAFGFESLGARTPVGELILAKPMTFSDTDEEAADALGFNVRFGPHAIKVAGVPAFVVPIQPRWHRLLFPDAEMQQPLWPGRHPFGNALRKAYLCNSQVRSITPGALLLFYRSGDQQGVTAIGVAEDTLVSQSPARISRFVGTRTVYSLTDIERLCRARVLPVLFRQARLLDKPIGLRELRQRGALAGPPQSIGRVHTEAMEWLRERLG